MNTALITALKQAPVLLVLSGLPGLGKSTIALELAAITGVDIVDLDACWRAVGWCSSTEQRQAKAYARAGDITRRLMRSASAAIVDSAALSRSYRRMILSWVPDGTKKLCAYFEPDLELSMERRQHISRERLLQNARAWETPTIEEGFSAVFALPSTRTITSRNIIERNEG